MYTYKQYTDIKHDDPQPEDYMRNGFIIRNVGIH